MSEDIEKSRLTKLLENEGFELIGGTTYNSVNPQESEGFSVMLESLSGESKKVVVVFEKDEGDEYIADFYLKA